MLTNNKTNLDLKNLAPISVYDRIYHFRKCIESLKKNDLAKHSILYVFSDQAKPGDEVSVLEVRKYAKSIKGFKKVNLIFQKKNNYEKNIKDLTEVPFHINFFRLRYKEFNYKIYQSFSLRSIISINKTTNDHKYNK